MVFSPQFAAEYFTKNERPPIIPKNNLRRKKFQNAVEKIFSCPEKNIFPGRSLQRFFQKTFLPLVINRYKL
jgi:hypothetical protein